MNYRSAPEPERLPRLNWRVALEQIAATALNAAIIAHRTTHPVLQCATASCSVDVLTVSFPPHASVAAVEAVLPVLEDAVGVVSAAQEYPYELDVILRVDTTAATCFAPPSRRIH